MTAKCNGRNDCRDNSDEKPDLCGESVITMSAITLCYFVVKLAAAKKPDVEYGQFLI